MIRWITERLGTAPWDQVEPVQGLRLLDVRELVDREGNSAGDVRSKIEQAVELLRLGERVVICCDYGMSRSNGIAAGALAVHAGIPFNEAVRRVIAATGERAIRIEVLGSVRAALACGASLPDGTSASLDGVVLTCSTGFLGSQVVAALRAHHSTFAPSRDDLSLDRGSLELDLLFKSTGARCLVHLANPRIYTTNESLGTSLTMLKNVLDVCRENDVHLIYTSSWEVFSGSTHVDWRPDDDAVPAPGGTYGLAKYLGEQLIDHFRRKHGLRATVLRLSPVFGPSSPAPRFIWNFMAKARRGDDIVAHRYDNGYPHVDLLFASDAVRAIVAAVDSRPCATVNVGSGRLASTTDIARLLVRRLGSASAIRHIQINRASPNVLMKIDRASDILDWQPRVGLELGLEHLITDAGIASQ